MYCVVLQSITQQTYTFSFDLIGKNDKLSKCLYKLENVFFFDRYESIKFNMLLYYIAMLYRDNEYLRYQIDFDLD